MSSYQSGQPVSLLPLAKGFTIYQSPYCPYCRKAVDQLERLNQEYQIPYSNIDLAQVDGGLESVLDYFKKYQEEHDFDPKHRTRPVIFLNGRFVGGSSELTQLLDSVNVS